MSSQIEIAQIVAMISSAYPNFAPTKETIGVYYELLKDLPSDLLKTATLQCCAEDGRKFAPSVGELRGAVNEIKRKVQGVPSALEAWSELLQAPKTEEYRRLTDEVDEFGRAIIEVTPYQWSHPLVRKVAVMLGFPKFPDWNSESFERAAFMKAYENELQSYFRVAAELPVTAAYIENQRRDYLSAPVEMKQLAERFSK